MSLWPYVFISRKLHQSQAKKEQGQGNYSAVSLSCYLEGTSSLGADVSYFFPVFFRRFSDAGRKYETSAHRLGDQGNGLR